MNSLDHGADTLYSLALLTEVRPCAATVERERLQLASAEWLSPSGQAKWDW